MTRKNITLLDSTLRDGAQGEGVSFSIADKTAIVREIDSLGIKYIEAGAPFSNPKDREFFAKAENIGLKNSQLVAFGSTRHKDCEAENDEGLSALLAAGTKTVSIFGKCSRLHIEKIIETSPAENAAMIEDSCRFLANAGREVFFDAEHFFDGYRADPELAAEMLRAAVRGGASMLVLCDTNGGAFPDEISRTVSDICALFPDIPIGVHCHNDCGMATASSIYAVAAGASHIQGTLLGIGERCGNADLSQIIPNMQLKRGYDLLPDGCGDFVKTVRRIAEIANVSISRRRPYIGHSAFAHKAGMHADAVLKEPSSFEHIPPEAVGAERRILVSEISGRSAVSSRLGGLLPAGDDDSARKITETIKQLELEGYQFEGADASFELLAKKCVGSYTPHFKLVSYRIISERPHAPDCAAAAMVKIRVGDGEVLRSAEGNGPVNALDKALRLALSVFYPSLSKTRLTDYKVRVMDSKAATASQVRVIITSSDGEREWSTVGVSGDIIEASFAALCDSIEYCLEKEAAPSEK